MASPVGEGFRDLVLYLPVCLRRRLFSAKRIAAGEERGWTSWLVNLMGRLFSAK
jgi:hypothetical protein